MKIVWSQLNKNVEQKKNVSVHEWLTFLILDFLYIIFFIAFYMGDIIIFFYDIYEVVVENLAGMKITVKFV